MPPWHSAALSLLWCSASSAFGFGWTPRSLQSSGSPEFCFRFRSSVAMVPARSGPRFCSSFDRFEPIWRSAFQALDRFGARCLPALALSRSGIQSVPELNSSNSQPLQSLAAQALGVHTRPHRRSAAPAPNRPNTRHSLAVSRSGIRCRSDAHIAPVLGTGHPGPRPLRSSTGLWCLAALGLAALGCSSAWRSDAQHVSALSMRGTDLQHIVLSDCVIVWVLYGCMLASLFARLLLCLLSRLLQLCCAVSSTPYPPQRFALLAVPAVGRFRILAVGFSSARPLRLLTALASLLISCLLLASLFARLFVCLCVCLSDALVLRCYAALALCSSGG